MTSKHWFTAAVLLVCLLTLPLSSIVSGDESDPIIVVDFPDPDPGGSETGSGAGEEPECDPSDSGECPSSSSLDSGEASGDDQDVDDFGAISPPSRSEHFDYDERPDLGDGFPGAGIGGELMGGVSKLVEGRCFKLEGLMGGGCRLVGPFGAQGWYDSEAGGLFLGPVVVFKERQAKTHDCRVDRSRPRWSVPRRADAR
jgi:hypothetical protein